ncbi:MAG: conjugative transposon protein TraM [Chitinophagaceae bacterium]
MKYSLISPKWFRYRPLLIALPLLTLPFILMMFWALHGGRLTTQPPSPQEGSSGINLEIPSPHLNKKMNWDKMRLYQRALQDSLTRQMRQNNYSTVPSLPFSTGVESKKRSTQLPLAADPTDPLNPVDSMGFDPQEKQVNSALRRLSQLIHSSPPKTEASFQRDSLEGEDPVSTRASAGLEQLHNGLLPDGEGDSDGVEQDMKQLNSLMNKALEIEHPHHLFPPSATSSQRESPGSRTRIFVVRSRPVPLGSSQEPDTLERQEEGIPPAPIKDQKDRPIQKFYGLPENSLSQDPSLQGALEASIDQTQVISPGSTLRMRLMRSGWVGKYRISGGQWIYGRVSLNQDRLGVVVNSIRLQEMILPVSLSVYDLDGLEGIALPGLPAKESVQRSGEQTVNQLGWNSPDQALGIQAASAGLSAARNLLSHRMRIIRVRIPEGYRVLLFNSK